MSKEILKYLYATVFSCLLMPIYSSYAAPPEQAYKFNTATWNMQGSGSSGGDNKWTQVRAMLTLDRALEILTLQESGSIPDNAVLVSRALPPITVLQCDNEFCPASADTRFNHQIDVFEWSIGNDRTGRETVYIYSLNMGNRLNLATISRYRADEIFVVPPNPHDSTTRRPILGIRVNQSAFFNIHAAAIGGGNEAPEQVIDIESSMIHGEHGVSSWMILGDYNRSPNSLTSSQIFQRLPAPTSASARFTRQVIYDRENTATQQSGNILDYAVIGSSARYFANALMIARVMNNIRSDHSAVRFSACRQLN